MRIRHVVLIALLFGFLPAALNQSRLEAQPTSCTVAGQNQFVRDVLFEYYFWYHELPGTNPTTFASPEAYLEAVRYKALDQTYSYIANRREQEAFFSESQFIGLGISTQFDGTEMRLSQVFPDSPASEAGLARGHRILSINGRTVRDLYESGQLGTAFGPNEEGVAAELVWRTLAGEERSARLVKRAVTIPTVSHTRVYDVEGRRVGYIMFRNFVEPSVAALDAAFTQLKEAGATELVLDLRYNGGGLVSVAQHLASLIGGQRTQDQLFAEFFHNDRHPDLNRTVRFQGKPNTLNLDRLIVVTTRASASASELVINALRPFIPVTIVGDTTFGKPVGQYRLPVLRQGAESRVVHPAQRQRTERLLQRVPAGLPRGRRSRSRVRRPGRGFAGRVAAVRADRVVLGAIPRSRKTVDREARDPDGRRLATAPGRPLTLAG